MENKLENLYPKNTPIGPAPIEEERLQLILERELKNWKIVHTKIPENPFITRVELYREYKFKSFKAVMEFMAKVAEGCNIFPHHPRWENTWITLKVWLTTWDIKHIISYKDIMLARFMDKTFKTYKTEKKDPYDEDRKIKEKKEFIAKARKLLAEDNIERVFDVLIEYSVLNQSDIINEITLITARLNRIRKSERIGDISREEADIEFNKIRRSVLDILKAIEKSNA